MWKYLRKLINALASGNTSYFKAIAFSFCPLIFKCLNKRLQIFKIVSSIKAAYPVRIYFIFQLLKSTMNSRSLFKKSLKRMKSFCLFYTFQSFIEALAQTPDSYSCSFYIKQKTQHTAFFNVCESLNVFFPPWHTSLSDFSAQRYQPDIVYAPKWYTDINTRRRSWEPWLLSVTSTGRRW